MRSKSELFLIGQFTVYFEKNNFLLYRENCIWYALLYIIFMYVYLNYILFDTKFKSKRKPTSKTLRMLLITMQYVNTWNICRGIRKYIESMFILSRTSISENQRKQFRNRFSITLTFHTLLLQYTLQCSLLDNRCVRCSTELVL